MSKEALCTNVVSLSPVSGTVTAIGNDVSAFWDGLTQGRNGISNITKFNAEDYSSQVAAELKGFDADSYVDPKEARRMDPFTVLGLAAGTMAVEDSGLDMAKEDPSRIGVIISSGIGGMEVYSAEHTKLLERGPRRVSPFFIPAMIPDILAGHLSIKYGFMGPNYCTVSACASSAHALGTAFMHLQMGDARCDGGGRRRSGDHPHGHGRILQPQGALHAQ